MSADRPNTIIKTYYVHSQPYDDGYAPFWDHEDDRQNVIHYLLYEDDVEVEIDLDTGESRYLSFSGKKLVEPTEWS